MQGNAEIAVILGQRGAGKSTLLVNLLKKKTSKRIIVIDTLGEHGNGRKIVRTPVAFMRAIKAKRFDIAVQFAVAERGFYYACRAAYILGDLLLVIEEVDWYVKAGYAPDEFSKLVRYGRHQGVEMICLARRPPDMWRNLTANANAIYSCRITEPRDIKYLSDFMGAAAAEKLKSLKTFEYVCYRDGAISRGKAKRL